MKTYDILAPAVRANPWAFYAELRAEPKIQRVQPIDLYVVARYADVVDVLERTDDFSSLEMAKLIGPIDAMAGLMGVSASNMPPTIISSDNPVHNRLRLIMHGRFSPRAVGKIDESVRRLTDDLVEKLMAKEEFDLVRDFTIPLPVIVIAQMLGIEEERFPDFKRWSDALVAIAASQGAARERYLGDMLALVQYFIQMMELRRRQPSDDLISTLIEAEKEEGRISPPEMIAFLVLLLVAGNETTTNLIGGMVEALLDNPDQLEKLRADPSLVTNAVEEGLRYCSPVQGLFRNATRDTRIGETEIPAGAPLMACYASANRDASVFPNPDQFDITRDARRHIAFGRGLHFCLGANLARREARIAISRLLPLLPRMERTRPGRDWVDNWFLRGPQTLPFALR